MEDKSEIIEKACQLAHEKLKNTHIGVEVSMYNPRTDCWYYKSKYQAEFDKYYDEYYSELDNE